jgi:hypothetical protein
MLNSLDIPTSPSRSVPIPHFYRNPCRYLEPPTHLLSLPVRLSPIQTISAFSALPGTSMHYMRKARFYALKT